MYLSVIIPAFNTDASLLKKALDSIYQQDINGIEVILVDDGSVENNIYSEIAKFSYPRLKYIKNSKNYGSSYARNRAMDISEGEFVMFLDSDAYLEKDFFFNLDSFLKSLSLEVAGLNSKIFNGDKSTLFSCGLKISSLYRVHDIGRNKLGEEFNESKYIDGINTCCSVVRRKVLEEVKEEQGYFDERFFFLFEDVELSLRINKRGYRFIFVPELVCFHNSQDKVFSDSYRRFLCFRNRWYMIIKYNNGLKLIKFLFKSIGYDFCRTLHFCITNRYFFKAFKDIYHFIWKK